MDSERIQHLYLQMLNWSDAKLMRHIIAHGEGADIQKALSPRLALLYFRLPTFGAYIDALAAPDHIAVQIVGICKKASDSDRQVCIAVICDIASDYLQGDFELESEAIQMLLYTGAKICTLFNNKGATLLAAVKDLQKLSGEPFTLNDIANLACRLDEATRGPEWEPCALPNNPSVRGSERSSSSFKSPAESIFCADEHYLAGRYEQAEPLYLLALVLLERQHPESHPTVLSCMERLGDTLYAGDKWKDAASVYKRLLKLRMRLEDKQQIISSLFKLAKSYEKLFQIEDAKQWYCEAISRCKGTEGYLYPNLLDSYAQFLKRNSSKSNDVQEAADLVKRADELRQKIKDERRKQEENLDE